MACWNQLELIAQVIAKEGLLGASDDSQKVYAENY